MTVWTRLGHAIRRRRQPATSAGGRQFFAAPAMMSPAREYRHAAADAARSPVSDVQAGEALAARVVSIDGPERNEQAASHAVASLSVRDDFLSDRAYRLLTAVLENRPVRPIDPRVVEVFARQERWCRLPLREAFADLATVDRRIGGIVDEAVSAGRRLEIDDTRGLLGVSAREPLLTSDIALNVALHYAGVMSGLAPPENLAKPYTELKPRAVTGDFFGTERPSATS